MSLPLARVPSKRDSGHANGSMEGEDADEGFAAT